MTRQREWQLKRKAEGNCPRCGKPAGGKMICDICADKISICRFGRPIQKRRPTKDAWAAVDWSKGITAVAAEMGVSYTAARYQWKKRTPLE